jgi:primase-polymerase (primpol)-like protein
LTQTITDAGSVVQVANIPGELREKPQWVLWRGEERTSQRTGEVKVSKVPIDPHTLNNARTTDPRTLINCLGSGL